MTLQSMYGWVWQGDWLVWSAHSSWWWVCERCLLILSQFVFAPEARGLMETRWQ
jgi:hypothetical protein